MRESAWTCQDSGREASFTCSERRQYTQPSLPFQSPLTDKNQRVYRWTRGTPTILILSRYHACCRLTCQEISKGVVVIGLQKFQFCKLYSQNTFPELVILETFNQCQTVSFTAEALPRGCWDEMQTTLELSLKSQGYCCSESTSFGSFVGCAEDKKGSRMIRACIWTGNFRHKTPPLSRGFCWGIPYFFFSLVQCPTAFNTLNTPTPF